MLSSVRLFSWAKCIGSSRGKRRQRFWEEDSVGKTLLSNLDDLSSDPWNPSQIPDMVTCIGIPGTPVARWGRGRHRRTAWMFMRQLIQGTQCKGRNETLPLIR